MTVDLVAVHHRALQQTGKIVAGIGNDQWHDPTPCEDWDVRELLLHLVSGNRWVKPLVDGATIEQVGDRLDGDLLGTSPSLAYETSAAEADDSFSGPGALESPCAVSYGPVPGAIYCGHRFIDVLVHGWDLAKATGQDTTLDPELAEACWQVVQPDLEMLAGSGAFGTTRSAPAGADVATRLLLALGREP